MRNVLLLGLKDVVVEDAMAQLQLSDIRLFAGGGLEDVQRAFATAPIDTVIIGAGIELDRRLQIVRRIFELSDKTTVHLKDVASGPQGYLSFVRHVLVGLSS
jgi:hypothetical protein